MSPELPQEVGLQEEEGTSYRDVRENNPIKAFRGHCEPWAQSTLRWSSLASIYLCMCVSVHLRSTKPHGYFWLSYYEECRQCLGSHTGRQAVLGKGTVSRHGFQLLPAVPHHHVNIHLTCLPSYASQGSKVHTPRNPTITTAPQPSHRSQQGPTIPRSHPSGTARNQVKEGSPYSWAAALLAD